MSSASAHESRPPMLQAHRGMERIAPENTMASFLKAARSGATWIETDVHVTEDGPIVAIHDATTDRTTDRHGTVRSLTARDLAEVSAGSWFSPEFADERIPTLAAVVAYANEYGMNLNLEFKGVDQLEDAELLVDGTIAELANLNPEREAMISSFAPSLLAEFGKKSDAADLSLLWHRSDAIVEAVEVMRMIGVQYLHPSHVGLTEADVSLVLGAGYGVNVWTVNSLARANELLNWGCTGIITDIPDAMAAGPFSRY